jgi:nucleotide-binding universal stress UspA family protein
MYNRVIVGTDGSETATRAVEAAAVIARAHGAELVVAHAFPARLTGTQQAAQADAPDEMKWRLSPGALAEAVTETAAQRAHRVVGVGPVLRIRRRCEPGPPIPVLLRLVDELDPDALIIGNRDMPLRIRLHRSVARTLVRKATCDVVVVDTIGRRNQRRQASTVQHLSWA